VKFTAGPGTKHNPYNPAPQKYDGVPKKTSTTVEGSLGFEGSPMPKIQFGGKRAMQLESISQSIDFKYRERTKKEESLFSLWEFEVAPESIPKDNMIVITPAACLRPTTTFEVPDNDCHPIFVMIASRYTMVNSRFRWIYRTPNNGTIGWRNFYHELLINMPVVDRSEGRISCTVFPSLVYPSQQSIGEYLTDEVYFEQQI
jgi:hypothetical protein